MHSESSMPLASPCDRTNLTLSHSSKCQVSVAQQQTHHPADSPGVSPLSRKRLLIVFGIAMAVFDIVILIIDQRLEATGGPSILGLELAGSSGRAAEVMTEWGEHGQYLARLSLWIDFGFMVTYGAFFALAALATRDYARMRGLRALAVAGIVMPSFAVLAALFDAAENIVWLLVLGGNGGGIGPPFATVCASLKFLLIALVIIYVLWGLISRLRQRLRSGGRAS